MARISSEVAGRPFVVISHRGGWIRIPYWRRPNAIAPIADGENSGWVEQADRSGSIRLRIRFFLPQMLEASGERRHNPTNAERRVRFIAIVDGQVRSNPVIKRKARAARQCAYGCGAWSPAVALARNERLGVIESHPTRLARRGMLPRLVVASARSISWHRFPRTPCWR